MSTSDLHLDSGTPDTRLIRNVPSGRRVARRRQCLRHLQRLLHWSGSDAMYVRAVKPRGAVILMYHSISDDRSSPWIDPANQMPPRLFERHMRFLAGHRRVIGMGELTEQLQAGRPVASGTVVITLDDGYLDNNEVAVGILHRYSLPATIYLPTGHVTREEAHWADRLYSMLRFRTRDRIAPDSASAPTVQEHGDCISSAGIKVLGERLLTSDYDQRNTLLATLEDDLRPAARPPRLTMNWDEVRELVRRNPLIEIGGHTVNHIDLRTHNGKTAQREIEDCRDELIRELGRAPIHFSFPYSRYSDRACERVRDAGFRSGVASGDDTQISSGAPQFALPRIEAPRSLTLLKHFTSGAYPRLSRALTGRA